MPHRPFPVLSIAIASATVLACSQPATPPTSPSDAVVPITEAAPDGSTLKVSAPTPVWPRDVEVQEDRPELVVDNAAPLFGDGVPLAYVFEVFDLGSNLLYQSAPVGSGDGRTAHRIGVSLPSNGSFRWRAYAVHDGERGPASDPVEFRVFNQYGPSCAHLGDELSIVQCRRAQFGYMNEHHRVEFLRRVAYALSRAGREHAPYGLLVKWSGNNCFGYSCDIICSNAGGVHRQWDVLSDEDDDQTPIWSRIGRIAPRGCETVQ